MAGWGEGAVGQLVPGGSRGVLNFLSLGQGPKRMHTNGGGRRRSGYVVFWTCVDLREGGKAPALLGGVVIKQWLDLQVLHGGGGHCTRWCQRRVTMATSNRSQNSCKNRVQ